MRLSAGEQPWIAGCAEGDFIVWTSNRVGDLLLIKPNAAAPLKIASRSSDPVIVADSHQPMAFAFWEQRNEDGTKIMALPID